jgi:hypothetical protein
MNNKMKEGFERLSKKHMKMILSTKHSSKNNKILINYYTDKAIIKHREFLKILGHNLNLKWLKEHDIPDYIICSEELID